MPRVGREHGFLEILDPGSDVPVFQAPTVRCVHCGGHFIKPRFENTLEAKETRIGRGWCQNCAGFVCGQGCRECVPWEQMLDNVERGRPENFKPIVAVSGFDGG